MPNPNRVNSSKKYAASLQERISASVAMIDYLIIETRDIDPMCACHLESARMHLIQDESARPCPYDRFRYNDQCLR